MKQVKEILDAFVESYCNILKNNLIGIYLHGSLAMGCFNPESSDVDILIVIEKDISFSEKRKLIDVILKLSDMGIKNDFEISVILEEDARHFKYPTPFVLHYSSMYKERYMNDSEFICGNGVDPDLASHITILTNRGICLFGKSINEVFEPVQKKYYIESIIGDIKSAKDSILDLPIYYILNLCRVLYFLREGVISSKKEGGEWGFENLPVPYKYIVKLALLGYKDKSNILQLEQSKLIEFADFMLKEIEAKYSLTLNSYPK
jgi:streptomycin 3"-adenylyltransferase